MKRIVSLVLVLVLIVSLASCTKPVQIKVGYLTGPTGIGMAKLISDNDGNGGNENYSFANLGNDARQGITKLLNGDLDIACAPTNDAANYINQYPDSGIVVLAINTLCTLYLVVENSTGISSFSDLQGKTIYTCQSGTPKVVLETLLEESDIDATVSCSIGDEIMNTPQQLAAKIKQNKIDIALAPEPIVSTVLSTRMDMSAISISTAWEAEYNTPLAMGCVLSTKEFVTSNPKQVDKFLSDYKSSIEFMQTTDNLVSATNYVTSAGIIADASIASAALKNLGTSIAYIDGTEMKRVLISFYNSIAITLPIDNFYYEK